MRRASRIAHAACRGATALLADDVSSARVLHGGRCFNTGSNNIMNKTLVGLLMAGAAHPAAAQDTTQLPAVQVVGEYAADKANSTTQADIALADYPASLQVVPAEVLQDRGVTRTEQLVDNVSGVHAEASYGGNGATFFNIRGFSESNGLRDGFRNYGYYAFRDVQNIEQVEVFKGPAGALYGGVGAVGGYVNTVSKRPQQDNAGEISQTVGSDALRRITLDINRAVSGDVSLRLNGAVEQNGTFRDNGGYASWSIAPAVTWDNHAGTSLTLLTEFNHLRRDGFDFGIPAIAAYRRLSRTRYFGLRDGIDDAVSGDYGRNDTRAATLLFSHALSSDWTLRVGGQYVSASQRSTQTFPNSTTPSGSLLAYSVYANADEDSRQYSGRVELAGNVQLAGMRHQILAGVDYGDLEQGGNGSDVYTMDIDLFDPAYVSPLVASGSLDSHQGQGKDYGVYFQDLVELYPQLKAMLGMRVDRFVNTAIEGGAVTGRGQQTAFSPRVGVTWQPTTTTSLFTDWSRSYSPNVGHSGGSITYDAQIAEQFEVGVKQALVADRLDASLALFNLDLSNILTTDPSNPLRQVLNGKQRSRGAELDVAGTILPGWKVIASYAYTDAKVEHDTDLPVGDALSNVPRHSGSVWSKYAFDSLPGLKIGAGVYYVGAREATLPNTFELSAYTRTDAMVAYARGPWSVQLNLLNVFDRKYYTGGAAGVFNYTLTPSVPATAQLTLSYRFAD
ncbi:TonB-dependent receptor [Xanthomonas graminis]|uniref:TonB-dependent receptor n=1 Tax=Xanthomonas graminis TaxID=3390026 RepID=UPI0025434306|nr:TonB-dependent siderophore receptor [Xanthomonas translucens]WIH15679.1 TonB-dependent siderophore receptor [Xanthomonas translucens pv. graminis]